MITPLGLAVAGMAVLFLVGYAYAQRSEAPIEDLEIALQLSARARRIYNWSVFVIVMSLGLAVAGTNPPWPREADRKAWKLDAWRLEIACPRPPAGHEFQLVAGRGDRAPVRVALVDLTCQAQAALLEGKVAQVEAAARCAIWCEATEP